MWLTLYKMKSKVNMFNTSKRQSIFEIIKGKSYYRAQRLQDSSII
jgi:hypothetical protein